jgi:hypothetical protein
LIEAVFAAADAQNGAEMVRLHSRDSHVIFVGAGSDTVWPGLPSVTAAIEAAHDGTASTRYGMERCVAFEVDGCGWGVGDGLVALVLLLGRGR